MAAGAAVSVVKLGAAQKQTAALAWPRQDDWAALRVAQFSAHAGTSDEEKKFCADARVVAMANSAMVTFMLRNVEASGLVVVR